jgi:hypothetical protein
VPPSPARMLYSFHVPGRLLCAHLLEEGAGEDDNRQNLEELARRMEALERENRELREALGSGASERQLETTQQHKRKR